MGRVQLPSAVGGAANPLKGGQGGCCPRARTSRRFKADIAHLCYFGFQTFTMKCRINVLNGFNMLSIFFIFNYIVVGSVMVVRACWILFMMPLTKIISLNFK